MIPAQLASVTSVWELALRRAELSPDGVLAVDEQGEQLTFAGLVSRAEAVATALSERGIGAGDVVSWQLPSWLESFVLAAACSRLGVIQNPLIPILRRREVGFITGQAGTRLLVVPGQWRDFDYPGMAQDIAAERAGLEVLAADRALPESGSQPPPALPAADPDEVRWYFYTSGTTAEPKGARHSDAGLLFTARGFVTNFDIGPDDGLATLAPVTHVGGIVCFLASLLSGCRSLLDEAFDPTRTPQFLREQGATLIGMGTPFFQAYLGYHRAHPELAPLFPRLRHFLSGGASKSPALHQELTAEMGTEGILAGYGMTECPMFAWNSPQDSDEILATTEGKLLPGMEAFVSGPDGKPLAAGEEGELRVRGPNLMKGYLDPALDDAIDENGFFRTGDLVRLDEQSNVTVTGRVKDIIIRNMENISAKELEDLLVVHPSVADCAVIGLADPRVGERACAVIVPADTDDPPTLDQLTDHLRAQGLSDRKLPEQLELVETLPRNPMGKIVKTELRDRFRALEGSGS